MAVWPSPQGPVILPILFLDRKIVDTGDPAAHQAMRVEFPVLIAVGPEPVSAVVMPFVGEPHGHSLLTVSPQLFDQAIIEFARPFAGKKSLDLVAAMDELCAVPPYAVDGIIPKVFDNDP